MTESKYVTNDIWSHLRQHTQARIGMGRCGGSLPTQAWLEFRLDHAQAKDAVHAPFAAEDFLAQLHQRGMETIDVASAAGSKVIYLRRPDLGRRLSEESRQKLTALTKEIKPIDINITVSDGLSAQAVTQVIPVLDELVPLLKSSGFSIGPVVVCRFGRVMIQDEIGAMVKARLSLILIGERPGLGTADSLGAYLVYNPAIGKSDADRNCVSNIRNEGLAPALAARKLHYLISESLRLQLSGVELKDAEAYLGLSDSTI